jgi:hypothetical protein
MTETTSVDGETALPSQVAAALFTTEAGLAQMRYRGTGLDSSSVAAACCTAGRMSAPTWTPTPSNAPETR